MKKNTLFIIFIVFSALAIGIWRDHQTAPKQIAQMNMTTLEMGTLLPMAKKLPEFQLMDMDNKPFTRDNLLNRWTFIFFGYTHCPKLCPMTIASLNQLSARLPAQNTQILFITIDPAHDDATRLKAFLQNAKYARSKIMGLTGEKEKIIALADAIGVHAEKETKNIVTTQHIEHGGAILLVNPEAKLSAIFTNTEKPNMIAQDFKNIVHQYSRT